MGRNKQARSYIVIYVGESSLGYIESKSSGEGEKPFVFGADRNRFDAKGGIPAIKEAFGKLFVDGAKNGSFKKGCVHVIFAPAYYEVALHDICKEENETFKVTRELVSDLMKSGGDSKEERLVTHCALGGYPTTSPFGKESNSLEAKIWSLKLKEEIKMAVASVVKEHLHREINGFHSESLVLLRAVALLQKENSSYLVALISPVTTELLVVRDGGVVATQKGSSFEEALLLLRTREILPNQTIVYRAEMSSQEKAPSLEQGGRDVRASDLRGMVVQEGDLAIDSDLLLCATLCATI